MSPEDLLSQLEARCEQLQSSRQRILTALNEHEHREQTRNVILREELIEAEKRSDALSWQLSACQKERDELAMQVSQLTEERDALNQQLLGENMWKRIFGG
jgi:chromosome segregation ATPase